jgi:hypothetical protein
MDRPPQMTIPVVLVPWDFASSSHADRMFNQRKAAGRGSEEVESWRRQQDMGMMSLYWIVSVLAEDRHLGCCCGD